MTRYSAILTLFSNLISQVPENYIKPSYELLIKLSDSIDNVAEHDWEAETLTRIAWWESGVRESIVTCKRKSSMGASGAFQVIPRNANEAQQACSSDLTEQAKLALRRVRESKTWCANLGITGADSLGGYTSGKCYKNNRHSRLRYGTGSALSYLMNR